MQSNILRSPLALFAHVAFCAATPAFAQVGPIQPVMVMVGAIPGREMVTASSAQ
jgi:hypothetical protein